MVSDAFLFIVPDNSTRRANWKKMNGAGDKKDAKGEKVEKVN